MHYLAVFSFTAAILYFYVGFHALRANRKSHLCRIFFVLNLCMTVWSFGEGFLYLAQNAYEYSFWNKIAAFGWCTFEAFVLYFALVLVGNKNIRYWYVKLIIIFPSLLFLYMVLFLFDPDIVTKPFVITFFYVGNFIYNFSYLSASIFLLALWGYRSNNRIRKKQAFIISICSLIPFLLNFLVQHVLPALHIITLPYIGQLFSLIMLLGVYYAITKYQFMSIPSSLITNELLNELTGLTVLIDPNGYIMKANRQAYELLEYQGEEIIGRSITEIMSHPDINRIMEHCDTLRDRVRLKGMDLLLRSGAILPLHISIIPLFIDRELLGGVLLIGEDIRTTRLLKEEIERHQITNDKLKLNNERILELNKDLVQMNINLMNKSIKDGLTNLYNHQYINEMLDAKLKNSSRDGEVLCLMMLDIDHFKNVNDRYGHLVGDMVLQVISDLLVANTREEDMAGRYGGEEFIVVLSGIKLEAAILIAERVRLAVCDYDYGITGMTVSISIGIAQYEGETPSAFINKSDMLLYQAKANGRNRVESLLNS
jgi:two-component system, cell cycle response regulator